MNRGSMVATHGAPVGASPAARRRWSGCVPVAVAFWLAVSAAGQAVSDGAGGRPADGELSQLSFESIADGARNGLAGPGMIGPTGACGDALFGEAELPPSESAAGWQQAPPWPQPAPRFSADDWGWWDGGGRDPGVAGLFGHHGGRFADGAPQVGPVRRWIGGLVGGPLLPFGPGSGAAAPWLREQWRFRPFSIGWFMGGVAGSPLLDDWVNQKSGYFAGYRMGWDFSRYWGWQVRLGFGWIELADSQRAIDAQVAADAAVDLPPDDPFFHRFDQRRDSDLVLFDLSLKYYPWGNTTWRPYLSAGLGAARIDFLDRLSVRRAETVLEAPLGVGVKYRVRDWLALTFDFTDNIAFGRQFDTVHDLSFTGGVEVLFGGTRTAYWPWNPGRHYW